MKLGILAALFLAPILAAEDSAQALNNLGAQRYFEGRYAEAESLYARALAEWRKSADRRGEVRTMNNLAVVYRAEGRYSEAESLYLEALRTIETPATLNNLAELYRVRGDARRAEKYAQRAITTGAEVSGPESPAVADGLHTLAAIRRDVGRFDDALRDYGRSRAMVEKIYGPHDARIARNLANVSEILAATGKYAEAESASRRALAIAEPNSSLAAQAANNLAQALRFEHHYEEAESLYRRAIAIWEGSPDAARARANLGGLYHDQGKEPRAVEQYTLALVALRNAVGPDSAEVALLETRLADVRRAQGRFAESLRLYGSSMPLLEKSLGPQDPRLANVRTEFQRALREARHFTLPVN